MRSKVVAIMMATAVLGIFASTVDAACGSCGPRDSKHKHGKQDKVSEEKKACAIKEKGSCCVVKKSCDVKAEKRACDVKKAASECVAKKACDVAKKDCPDTKKCCVSCKPQKTCPVMGGKVNKEQYVDVKGYRVYVCCPGCKSKIKDNPEKYIEKIKENGETPMRIAEKKECKNSKR